MGGDHGCPRPPPSFGSTFVGLFVQAWVGGWTDGGVDGWMDGCLFPEQGTGSEGWGCPLGATCAASWPGVGCWELLDCPAPLGTPGLPRRAGHGPHRIPKRRERPGSARGAEPLLARVCSRPARCPSRLVGFGSVWSSACTPAPLPHPHPCSRCLRSPGLPRPRCPLGVLRHVGRICTMPGLCLWFVDGEL